MTKETRLIPIDDAGDNEHLTTLLRALLAAADERGPEFSSPYEVVLPESAQDLPLPARDEGWLWSGKIGPTDFESVELALEHKRKVREAATTKVAQLALLYLSRPQPTSATEREVVADAWDLARRDLGHRQFVCLAPTSLAALRSLAQHHADHGDAASD